MIFIVLSWLSSLFLFVSGIRKRNNVIWWYAVVDLVSELLTSGTKHFLHAIDYKFFAFPFLLFEFVLLSAAFRKTVLSHHALFYALVYGLTMAYALRTLNAGPPYHDISGATLFFFAYIIYGICGFHILLRSRTELFLDRSFEFWLNLACLIYGSGAILLFSFHDEIQRISRDILDKLWLYLFVSLNILKNLSLGTALIRARTHT